MISLVANVQRTFKNAHTYKSHLRRAHKEVNLHQPVVRREDSVAEEGMEIVIEDTPPEQNGKKGKKIKTLQCTMTDDFGRLH